MRRAALLLCVLVAGWTLAAWGSAAGASAGRAAPVPTAARVSYAAQVAAREAAARAQAAALLASLQLPPGAVPSAVEPADDGGFLAKAALGALAALPNVADEHGWWVIPGTPGQALAYVHEHLPAGARWASGRYPPHPVPGRETAILKRPDGGGALGERVLALKLATLPGGQTGLRADAEVLWLPPPAAVPPGTRLLRVRARLVGPFHTIVKTLTLRSASEATAIAHLVNASRVQRPSFIAAACPAQFGSVLLSFLRRPRAAPLATASFPVGGCGAMVVKVSGRFPVRRAVSPSLLRALEPALGLAFPP